MEGCGGKLGRPRCRPRWDTHLNSRSLLNWKSSLTATVAGSFKKCRNGQVKTIWLPFSGCHNYVYCIIILESFLCFALHFLANLSKNLSCIIYRKFLICFALRCLDNLNNSLSYIIYFLYILRQCFRLF